MSHLAQRPAPASERRRRRIAFCLPALARGGMERATLTVAKGLVDTGHDVDLIVERKQGGFVDALDPRIRLRVLARTSKRRAYAGVVRSWPAFGVGQLLRCVLPNADYLPIRRLPSLVGYLLRERPDVVFAAHGRLPIYAVLAARMAATGARIVIVEHSTLSRWLDAFREQPEKHRRWAYRLRLARGFYPRADCVVGVSQGVTRDLADLGIRAKRSRTLYNAVVLPAADAPARPAHPWFEADNAIPLVLAVGRLVAEKDFALLIDAFAALRARRAARLMIIGEGEQRAALEARIAGYGLQADIALPGWWDEPQRAMAHADVFVLSSWFEGLGIVVIEALASGCPVVAVDCPSGPREILADGRYGRLTPMGDRAKLAEAIAATLNAPRCAERLIERAREFSEARGVAGYIELINDLSGASATHVDRG